jgi:putative endonuclease
MNPAPSPRRLANRRRCGMNPAPSPMHYVYLLKSLNKSKWMYVGITSNLKNRLEEHNSAKSIYTSKYLPVELVYYEAYRSLVDAENREKSLKNHGNSLGLLKKRIVNCLEEGAG